MNQKAFRYILVLMSISLLGIIALQAYWIYIKVQQKAADFDTGVYKSLSDVVEQIQNKDAVVFVQNLDFTEKVDSSLIPSELEYIIRVSEMAKEASIQERKTKELEAKREAIERGFVIHHSSSGSLSKLELHDTLLSREKELKKLFEDKKERISIAINQMAYRYAFSESNLKDRLANTKLDSLIGQSLKKEGITEETFSFAVKESGTDSIVFKSENLPENYSFEQAYTTPLFNETEEYSEGTLALSFPNKTSYIIQSMWLTMLISLLLTGIMIFTFGYTVHAILRQKKISKIKSDFINNMTHEFKTPIATISLAVDSMLHPSNKNNDEELKKYGAIIKKENNRMNDQIERVLEVAKFEKDEIQLNLKPLDLHELLKELYDNFNMNVKDQAGDIQLVFKANSYQVNADRLHLYNAMRNIVENAIKFSSSAFRIKISTENSNGKLLIRFEDKGIGMDSETQKHVFDRFYRKTEGDIHTTKGFGLGLNYVKEVLNRMQADIWVESKLNEGSCFTISISTL